jgi:AcrR family transcriptional regulator
MVMRRPGRPKKADAADTKAELRQAALRLFARHGYAGTSIRAIAREVGLSESGLYAHFAGKQAIFDAVLAEFGPRGPATRQGDHGADQGVDPSVDPQRYLRELAGDFLDDWDRPDARLFISLVTRDGLLHTPALRDALETMRDAVRELFDRWLAAGLIPADLGPGRDLALTFTGPIGLTRLLHLHADATDEERRAAREDVHRHVDTFIRAVSLGVGLGR